jgi:hypothetical protein
MVNVGTAINKALTKIVGAPPRSDMVTWFNEIVKSIYNVPREWAFLDEPLTLPIVNNQITLPATITELIALRVGTIFYTPVNQLSVSEAAKVDNAESSMFDTNTALIPPALHGYTLDAANVITFHPPIATLDRTPNASVIGELSVQTDYADNDPTIFPDWFENLFIVGLRMNFYDLDKDGRFTKENMQYQMEMSMVKARDNRRKALMHYHPRGYTKG